LKPRGAGSAGKAFITSASSLTSNTCRPEAWSGANVSRRTAECAALVKQAQENIMLSCHNINYASSCATSA